MHLTIFVYFVVVRNNNAIPKHLTFQLYGCCYFISVVSHSINFILIHIHHNHVEYAQCTCSKHKIKRQKCTVKSLLTLPCTKRLDKHVIFLIAFCYFIAKVVTFPNSFLLVLVYRFWSLVLL